MSLAYLWETMSTGNRKIGYFVLYIVVMCCRGWHGDFMVSVFISILSGLCSSPG